MAQNLKDLLPESPTRAAPLRKKAAPAIPVDVDSRLHLIRFESVTELDVEPIFQEEVSTLLSQLVSERESLDRLEEEGLAQGTFVAINNRISQSVPHLHVHIVPRRKKDELKGFFWPRQKYQNLEAIQKAQYAIRTAVGRLQDEPFIADDRPKPS